LVTGLATGLIVLTSQQAQARGLAWLAIGAGIVAVVSWVDDLRSLPHVARLTAHFAAAGLGLFAVGSLWTIDVPLVGVLPLAWFGFPLGLLWVVGLTNSYNFMDGIDGIAGAQAVVAGAGWCLVADALLIRSVGLVVAAASLGFLIHNWHPARIFMGDVGSAFLGYTLAAIPILAAPDDPRLAFAGVLLVWPFVFDTGFTFLRRLSRHENVFRAHRSHLYQRLVIAGWHHGTVSVLYAALASVGVGFAVVWLRGGTLASEAVVVGLAAAALGLWALVVYSERRKAHHWPDGNVGP
jgi:UDP-N-acetylmuramyl pentapeptide phosphotransferase/UDP-N-acetylglucosamine-1-phosphate transferase